MSERYQVIDDGSEHWLLASVVDTTTKPVHYISHATVYETVCECCDRATAEMIARALNSGATERRVYATGTAQPVAPAAQTKEARELYELPPLPARSDIERRAKVAGTGLMTARRDLRRAWRAHALGLLQDDIARNLNAKSAQALVSLIEILKESDRDL